MACDPDPKDPRSESAKRYVLPDLRRSLPNLNSLLERCPQPLRALGEVFKRNMDGVVCTMMLPYIVSEAGMLHLRRTQLRTAIRMSIRAQMYRAAAKDLRGLPVSEEEAALDDEDEGQVEHRTSEALMAELRNPEGRRSLISAAAANLVTFDVAYDELSRGGEELLRQCTVLIWSSLEVLAQDLFIAILNRQPQSVINLIRDEDARRLFQIKALQFETLAEFGYDVSGHMGDILARARSIDSIPVMKIVYRILSSGCREVIEALNDRVLWLLVQRRNLIVHRRGIVDADYLAATADNLDIGSELIISPEQLATYLTAAMRAASALLQGSRQFFAEADGANPTSGDAMSGNAEPSPSLDPVQGIDADGRTSADIVPQNGPSAPSADPPDVS
jgi:hypothetical protein